MYEVRFQRNRENEIHWLQILKTETKNNREKKKKPGSARKEHAVAATLGSPRERPVTQAGCVKSTQSAQVSVGHAKRVQHTSIHADNHAHI